jgi:hypothetical protein
MIADVASDGQYKRSRIEQKKRCHFDQTPTQCERLILLEPDHR